MDAEKAWQLAQERHAQHRIAKSVLSVDDLDTQRIREVVQLGLQMKRDPQRFATALQGKKVALLFQKTSTRTRCSFETGIFEMGGFSSWISWESSNLIRAELAHEVRVLSHYYHALMARVNSHQSLEIMARYSRSPVINGLSDLEHPCQALSDFMTLWEYYGPELAGLRLLYMGDAANNVCTSLIKAAPHFGVEMAVAAPPHYGPRAGDNVRVFADPLLAAQWADVIYTDTWVSMGYEAETERRLRDLAAFQVSASLLAQCSKKVLVMHCLPAHIGEEITAAVLESAQSIVFDQAENRSHAQKALLYLLLCRW